ncbi:hypothetical protein LRP67_12550 [Nocardioides sp. cx-169]|uniref:hypothetical protein n=1 Tax=Nocardioides sp. cx-169 TaxID=2899080 RepID=UPI001E519FEB|nr:hypothetical protein [Nocardioides sp. cx-169]MCD4534917.1 hypothetical protein [Nocardioides sp. cx-169]
MPTTSAEPPGESRSLSRAVLVAACCLALAGCTSPRADDPPPRPSPSEAADSALPPTAPVPPDLLAAFRRVLDRRASALLAHDLDAFRSGVAARGAFRGEQETYFANLAQLPLATVSYEIDPGSLLRRGDHYWVAVDVSLQLAGYDAVPVASVDRYRFSPSPRHPSRFVLSSVSDAAWEERQEVRPQPWDLGPVVVRQGRGVLGVFDEGSVEAADPLIRSVERGVADVGARVPEAWDGAVVVYALSDRTFLATLDDVPGGDPEVLDALTFPVAAGRDDATVASTRFVLSPEMVARAGPQRDRLVRHELTHVALGKRDDDAPLWLSEGIAEYVSVQSLAPEDRRLERAALEAAEAGVDALPADGTFNDDGSAAHYGLSWWACEYVARTYGEPMLWSLLDQIPTGGEQQERLEMVLGLRPRQLARRSALLMIRTFDPGFLQPEPSATASPSGTPSAVPTTEPSAPGG